MNPLRHVAIIMDGNGRWGLKKNKSRNYGHKAGLDTVETIIKSSVKNKIKYLTLFAFSTENWKRPKNEIKFLINLLDNFIDKKINEFKKKNIRLKIIGDISIFNKKLKKKLNDSEKITLKNKKLQVNLALNYGSKAELIRAFKKLNKKKLKTNFRNLEKNLYTAETPDPEILIRTGNTHRLSNFLLWQLAYAEIHVTDVLWPDFDADALTKALIDYQSRRRRFGGV